MHRIDGPGATPDNRFTEGDPTQGVPATTVTGPWLNAIQEEIANVVEDAGLELDKADNTQLAAAVRAIIDANQVLAWYTGDVRLTMRNTADEGWVLCDDGTIGPTGSAATTRADDDTEALFTLLWNNVADGFAPVSGGRGVSAAADWAASKTISLTRMLGRALAIAGGGAGLSSRSLGQHLGAETHVLTDDEMPAHSHTASSASAGNHSHSIYGSTATTGDGVGGSRMSVARGFSGYTRTEGLGYHGTFATSGVQALQTAGAHTHSITVNSTGGGDPHPIMQPTAFLNAMVKL